MHDIELLETPENNFTMLSYNRKPTFIHLTYRIT